MTDDEKVRQNKLRRAAARQGLKLTRSHRRDVRALEFGRYCLTTTASGEHVLPEWSSVNDVEEYLYRRPLAPPK